MPKLEASHIILGHSTHWHAQALELGVDLVGKPQDSSAELLLPLVSIKAGVRGGSVRAGL